MTQIISRLYAYARDAEAAVNDLRAHRLRDNEIFVVRPPLKGERPCVENIVAAIVQCALMQSEAMIYAKRVARGGTLVAVHAPFDKTERVSVLLDIRDPVLRSVGPKRYPPLPWDKAAPFSSFMQWPTLYDEPTPFANLWSLPTLAKNRVQSSRRRRRSRSFRSPAPLSDGLGISLLSASPTPLSDKLGLSLLSAAPTPLSDRLGLSLLSESPTPLSDRMNWRVLTDNSTPLSSYFDWQVLI
jgi:hypothetical protein